MSNLDTQVNALRRPSILIRAARLGTLDYNRNRDLKRLMREPAAPPPADAVRRLLNEEATQEDRRQSGDAGYSLTRHIDLLIALMSEIRLLRLGTA